MRCLPPPASQAGRARGGGDERGHLRIAQAREHAREVAAA
jgi:hypothetical protein